MSGKLYLIPNVISEDGLQTIPSYICGIVEHLRFFFVEEEKAARRFLKQLNPQFPIALTVFFLLNEHTSAQEAERYFKTVLENDAGIISEQGCPCVADPGANIVLLAHKNNREVIPLVGPSSILLALMASVLNGQNFAFNGYLPKEKHARLKKIKDLENRSFKEVQTQIFMETPYHNQNVFEDILAVCDPETLVCIAADLTSPTQYIKTRLAKEWKKQKILLNKRPALFLIQKLNQ